MVYEDFVNILVSGLSGATAVLIGWQIYQIISINSIRKEISAEKQLFAHEKNKMLSLLYFEIALTYYRAPSMDKAWWVYSFEYYIVKSAAYAVRCVDDDALHLLDENLESIVVPMVGSDYESEKEKINTISRLSRMDIKRLRSFNNVGSYFN